MARWSISLLVLAAACARTSTESRRVPPAHTHPRAPAAAEPSSIEAATAEIDTFRPLPDMEVSRFPMKVADVKIECPAASVGLADGEVVVRVEVRDDGTVRGTQILESLGHGCDEVASRAISRMRFEPALDLHGAPADYVITHYVYEFRAATPPIDPRVWAKWYLAELHRASASCRAAQSEDLHRCLCAAACELVPTVAPPNGATTLRLPFVDVDGWTVDLDAKGRARSCGLTRVGAPDAAFTTTCGE